VTEDCGHKSGNLYYLILYGKFLLTAELGEYYKKKHFSRSRYFNSFFHLDKQELKIVEMELKGVLGIDFNFLQAFQLL
jgi:hypothetical protein